MQNLFNSIHGTKLEKKLAVIGTDGNASMSGKYNGCIRGLKELLNTPLQWMCTYYILTSCL